MTPHYFASYGFSSRSAAAPKVRRWAALAPLLVLGGCGEYDFGDIFDTNDGNGQGGPRVCIVDGVRHRPGDTFPSSDGCNTCSCREDGQVACTLRACVPDPDALQLGDACGGFRPVGSPECDTGLFCQHQAGALCGAADAPGECVLIPDVCADIFDPVCGCDGLTYGNACEAAANLTGLFELGACEPRCPESCPVIQICRLCDDGSCAAAQVTCNPDGSCGETNFVCQ